MTSKKKMIVVALVSGLMLTGYQQAFAAKNAPAPGPKHRGDAQCDCRENQPPKMSDEMKKKMDTFFDQTLDLRKQLAMKQAEKFAMMKNDKIDPAAFAKVAGELFDLRATLEKKAREAGVPFMAGHGPDFGKRMGPKGARGPQGPMMGPDKGDGPADGPQDSPKK